MADWGWDPGINHIADDIAKALNGGKAPSDTMSVDPTQSAVSTASTDPMTQAASALLHQSQAQGGPAYNPDVMGLPPPGAVNQLSPMEQHTFSLDPVQTQAATAQQQKNGLGGDAKWRAQDRAAYTAAQQAGDVNGMLTIQKQAWINHDHDRATSALQEQEGRLAWKASLAAAAAPQVGGSSSWKFDHQNQLFNIWNPKAGADQKGGWENFTAEQLANNASPEARQAGPAWMWAKEQQKANQQYIDDMVNQSNSNQRAAAATTSRYKFIPQYL